MEKMAVPRLELETFSEVNYKVPLLNVEHYPFNAQHFIIKNREQNPVNNYISPNRRNFFKVFHITSGTGILTIGLHQYNLSKGYIAFLHPDEIMSWQTTSADTGGHFCLIHPKYFEGADHVFQLFRHYRYFNPSKAVVHLKESESAAVNEYFELILKEEQSSSEDKKQAILLYLQMMLLEVQRAGKNLADVAVSETYRYIHGFLALLESSFQIQGPDKAVKIKNAAEFAGQLNVHPNYLNSIVKNHTGKTLREHIQERLIYEAKTLLLQTNWDIGTISYVLGFSGHAAFTSFFNKKEKVSPSVFRESVAAQANI